MLCLSGFELYSRWVPLTLAVLIGIKGKKLNPTNKSPNYLNYNASTKTR